MALSPKDTNHCCLAEVPITEETGVVGPYLNRLEGQDENIVLNKQKMVSS